MRRFIARMVHTYNGNVYSVTYKYFMILVTIVSLIPLTFKGSYEIFRPMEFFCTVIFVVDFALRWLTADYKFKKHHWLSFVRFPARLIAVIDIIVIFASFCSLFDWWVISKYATMLIVLRVIRLLRYSRSVRTIMGILQKSKKPLSAVGTLAVGYIFISAIFIFNVEPQTFPTFFDAIYWSTVSLTTVGYGDLYPVTQAGRIVAMISSFFGIAIVALPAGIVTAEYTSAIRERTDNEKE